MGSRWSELSMVTVTSARPSGARDDVPAKMTSSILPPRSVLAPCSPITQASASTTFDLPEPFGPTMQVTPVSKAKVVGCANDLNPLSVTLFRCIQTPSTPVDSPTYATRGLGAGHAGEPRRVEANGRWSWDATRPSFFESANSLDARIDSTLSSLFASNTRKEVTDDAHDEPRL